MQDPYRPHAPPPDPELARLAMQGQQRRAELAAGRQQERQQAGGSHLKTAIGAYRGSTLKRVLLAGIIAGAFLGAIGAALSALGRPEIGGFLVPGFLAAFVGFMVYVFVPPLASQSAIDAEQMWMTSLPFALHGYFEALAAEPRAFRTIAYEIVWREGIRTPDPSLLHGVFCAVDPNARLDHSDSRQARVTGGTVSGITGIRVNRVPVYRNHRLAGAVHSVVEQVLQPLHRSHPIARVEIKG
jgi:hypothetical protein